MRLAHHLWRDTSGIWYFRVVVPRRLREILGRSLIKQSLRTRDPVQARAWSYVLSARCAQIFATAQGQQGAGMSGKHWDDDAVNSLLGEIRANSSWGGVRKWEVETPDGYKLRTDGSQSDHENGMDALRAILKGPKPGPTASVDLCSLTLDEAIKDYAEVEGATLLPNTWSQRSRALEGFAETIGGYWRVEAITRPMASVWSDGLLRARPMPPTVSVTSRSCLRGWLPRVTSRSILSKG